ncbi:hypothetical protein AB4455_10170 [Vibrio sp. 10N.261.46.E12]|uniref:hypothetical protein n=1 Tax=unclassified Vibrio TaxID=2614977 RepID=UPI000976BF5A|nr:MULTISPECIES: hypothetical protein [unclassified Vibrio]OMO36169.1 hypothetical protein BH584_05175 [Vibrio sp. 10N.261.45.E1]PMJ34479.1 hypothetical protein BCU27_03360 [Vibrio sp. 10N.286.45.B6]PML88007.1 hypothetical protein BCT66_10430 [Vibrio sp. 10N.261.49.E11]PMM67334.1 hypothetical protein BCT48_14900 [Vibrio sp. 10N.261.46.F12]PMM81782.1 hypothetical protein BCT46_15355 [Vibrio sp. 10N.261.46.E8]
MQNEINVEKIAQKNVFRLLAESGANTSEEAVLALTKMIAVATESLATLVDHETSIEILGGVKSAAQFKHQSNNLAIQPDVVAMHSTPALMQ